MAISHRNFMIQQLRRLLERPDLTDKERMQALKLLGPLVPFVPRPERTKKARVAKAVLTDNRPRWLEQ